MADAPSFEALRSWTQTQMPLTARAGALLPDLTGVRLACSMHLEVKMVPAIDALLARGARVFLTTCNPHTVCDQTMAWCRARGADGHAFRGMSEAEREVGFRRALDFGPTHFCEMGADLTAAWLSRGAGGPLIQAALEATGSGMTRLAGMKIPYPVFNWDDLPIKEGLHNRHMVGLVACQAFFERTRLTFHGKRVLVVGYGLVGRGVCDAARAYGGQVRVVERHAGRALEARFAGEEVSTLDEALPTSDVVITATGARHVLGADHFPRLKDGAFLLNVGHADHEIDVKSLLQNPHDEALPYLTRVRVGGRTVYLFAQGSMANLTAGHGDSLNAFDVTLAAMVAGIGFMVTKGSQYSPGLHLLPEEAWSPVAQLAMEER